MSRTTTFPPEVLSFIQHYGVREHEVLARCRLETEAMGMLSAMQIGPDQGAFMAMLARIIGAKRCLEIGVFTGYSALAIALALPEDGHITACDISEDYTARARGYWNAAGVAGKITLELGPAVATLERLLNEGRAGSYDMAFIDADKPSYGDYYEASLKLLRPGGLIILDNVLWSGKVADPSAQDEDTVALRRLNEKIHADARVEMCLIPMTDGVTLARKHDE